MAGGGHHRHDPGGPPPCTMCGERQTFQGSQVPGRPGQSLYQPPGRGGQLMRATATQLQLKRGEVATALRIAPRPCRVPPDA
jgi:hypothetical protein